MALIAAASAGAGVSIGVGYLVDTHTPIGDGQYTARDATIDGLMGAVGVGGVLKTANYGRRAYKYHKAVKRADAAGEKTVAIRSGIKYNDDVLVSGVKIARDDAAIRAGLHSAAMSGGEMIKHDDRKRPGQQTTIVFGGRKIVIHDPVVSTDISTFRSASGQSSSSSKVNRSTRQTSRSAKSTRKSGSKRRCRCKDGSYSVNCC